MSDEIGIRMTSVPGHPVECRSVELRGAFVPVQMWRYHEPNNGKTYEGWYIAFLDSTGALSVQSDYGDYSYRWNAHGFPAGLGFREFLTQCNSDYILRKLARHDELQPERTEKSIREAIIHLRREGKLTKEEAAEEWSILRDYSFDSEAAIDSWLRQTELPEAWEYAVYDHPQQARAFMEHVWPRLRQAILNDLNGSTP